MEIKSNPSDDLCTNFIGSVRELQSNDAITFAEVVLTDENGKINGDLTDEAGNFAIKNLPPGVYKLRISADCHEKIEHVFKVKRHKNYQLNIKLAEQLPIVLKPVIYLYPAVKQDVQVRLNYNTPVTF